MWVELNHKVSMIETKEFVVMPNHLHVVIVIRDIRVGADLRVGPALARNGATPARAHTQMRPYPGLFNGSKQ
jgi:hypothetical protein